MQLTLDAQFEAATMARATDGPGSHAAAERMVATGEAASQREFVYRLVTEFPGSTSAELAEYGDVSRHMVARRLPELRKQKRVESKTPEGEHEYRWYPT